MPQKNSAGWKPTVRNRKIGTAYHGTKQRQDFGIPSSWHDDRVFWERLQNPTALNFNVDGHEFVLLIEPTLADFKHHVSICDLIDVLKVVPIADRRDIKVFAFRQPSRKEFIHSPVWGRLGYWADFGPYSGVSIILEAQPMNLTFEVDKKASLSAARELDLLRQDGHLISPTPRSFQISCPPWAIRNTQLYRTLLHEIGHYVDFMEKVLIPAEQGQTDAALLHDLYRTRPKKEREAFADRYARVTYTELMQQGALPFDPRPMPLDLLSKIEPKWFNIP